MFSHSLSRTFAFTILLAAVLALCASACGDRNLGPGDDGGSDGAAREDTRAIADGAPSGEASAGDGAPAHDTSADSAPVDNQRCTTPRQLALGSTGQLEIKDDTAGQANQFGTDISCGSSSTFDGAQRYYLVALAAGKTYRVTLEPDASFDAALYAFAASTGCSAQAIDAACEGYVSDAQGAGKIETITISPIIAQDWVIVADSYTASEAGPFRLRIEEIAPPSNGTCSAPAALALVGGSVKVNGDTTLAANQFGQDVSCGTPYDFDGAQVYYKVALQGGKHYEVRVTSNTFDTALYAFEATTPCSAAAINLRCAGAVSDETNGKPDVITLSPKTDGDYIIVVDSDWDDGAGTFALSVDELKLPGNITCAAPSPLALAQGSGQVKADTSKSRDEFAGAIDCGATLGLDGPQLYYRVALAAGKTYRVDLTPNGFDAALYAFPAATSCQSAALNAACAAHFSDKAGSKAESVMITPAQNGDYIVVVDSYSASAAGAFTLDIQQITTPTNTTCQNAKTITLSNGQATESADTSLSVNEFGRSIDCGGSYDYDGPQLYYRVRLEASKTYSIGLTPSAFDGSLYAFPASAGCSAAAINIACAPYFAEKAGSGGSESLSITPQSTGDWIVVVDSWLSGEGGAMSLAILSAP
ncbi:MAG: hypothetical protein KC503_42380 [Myxococcales bacterium]|nr:hypothetical protein [Myxococcales bacterium]